MAPSVPCRMGAAQEGGEAKIVSPSVCLPTCRVFLHQEVLALAACSTTISNNYKPSRRSPSKQRSKGAHRSRAAKEEA